MSNDKDGIVSDGAIYAAVSESDAIRGLRRQLAEAERYTASITKGLGGLGAQWKILCDKKDAERARADKAELERDIALQSNRENVACADMQIADLTRERDEARAACVAMREALGEYAECSDCCTCGDGWSHNTALDALAAPNPGQPIIAELTSLRREKDARIYYQDIVYVVCNWLDAFLSQQTICGTLETPNTGVQDGMKLVADELAALRAMKARLEADDVK